jgi:hypothetical protein
MEHNKKEYKSPVLFDLSTAQAIGACTLGAVVSDCITGALFRINCVAGSDVLPMDCVDGSSAWRRRAAK